MQSQVSSHDRTDVTVLKEAQRSVLDSNSASWSHLSLVMFWRTNKLGQISSKESCSIQNVMNVISSNRTRLSPDGLPIIYKTHMVHVANEISNSAICS